MNGVPDLIQQTQRHNPHPAAWFEPLYAQANRNPDHIPWAKLQPHPYLLQTLTPPPSPQTAIVIGCGLGDDAQAIATAGYSVTAFDISPTAIAWCQQRFPDSPVTYTPADLLNLPDHWHHTFHLVWENRTLQSLPLNVRPQAIAAIARLIAPHGKLRLATHWRPDHTQPDGPPWPLSDRELGQFSHHGLQERDRQIIHDPAKNLTFAHLEFDRP